MSEALLKKDELAALLRVTPRHLEKLTKRRVIPFIKLGRSIRYKWSAVEKALDKVTVKERS